MSVLGDKFGSEEISGSTNNLNGRPVKVGLLPVSGGENGRCSVKVVGQERLEQVRALAEELRMSPGNLLSVLVNIALDSVRGQSAAEFRARLLESEAVKSEHFSITRLVQHLR